jgi:hypothetical protein
MVQLLIETKKNGSCYKFVEIYVMVLQDFVILTFKNCLKNYDYFNSLSINQIKKRTILGPFKNLKH